MAFSLYRDCVPSESHGYASGKDYETGQLVGEFPTEDGAYTAAFNAGLMVPCGEDEGGPSYSKLGPRHMIVPD